MVGPVRRWHNVFLMKSFEHEMSLKIEHVGAIRRWYVSDVLLGLVCWFRSLVALVSIRSVCKFGMLVPLRFVPLAKRIVLQPLTQG